MQNAKWFERNPTNLEWKKASQLKKKSNKNDHSVAEPSH